MATTKANVAIVSAQALVAGDAYPDYTSSSQAVTTDYGSTITMKLTNLGTGPTVPAQCEVQYSADGGTVWNRAALYIAGVTASTEYDFIHRVPPEISHFRVLAGNNTVQNVTFDADYGHITAV